MTLVVFVYRRTARRKTEGSGNLTDSYVGRDRTREGRLFNPFAFHSTPRALKLISRLTISGNYFF